jgi:hypothetical protein
MRVEFYVDNALKWTETSSPYQFNGDPAGQLNTSALADGTHGLNTTAVYSAGTSVSKPITVRVANSVPVPIPVPTPTPTPPPLTNLPAWVNALAPGEWYQIPNTAMSSAAPASPQPPGGSGPASKVIAWTSFVVDTRTSKVYSVANGGHFDYAGNEVDVLDLERDQPLWSQLLAPTPTAQLTNCQSYYADDRPVSRHSYYGVTFNEIDDRIMLFGGANWCSNGGFHSAISSYNIGANSYNGSGTHPTMPAPFGTLSSYILDPSTGDVYASVSQTISRWNRSSNTFTPLNATGTGAWGYTMAAFDTSRGRLLILGGADRDHHLYTVSSNAFSQVTISGANASLVTGAQQESMVYVAAMDRFLIRQGGTGGAVQQVDPTNFAVTALVTTGGTAIPSTQNGPYNKFLYVPRLRGAVYVPSYPGNAWFLRLY